MSTPHDLEVPTAALVRPSPRTIAFAVSIVRSKPQELTIAEYIRLLRLHVAKDRRENAASSIYKHLDTSSYWRSECERIKNDLKSAHDESLGLRREIETLKARLDTSRPSSPNKKRKKQNEDIVPYPRSPKRPKREASPTGNALSSSYSLETLSDEFNQGGEIGNALLRSVFHIHALLKNPGTDHSELVHHLVRAASTIPKLIDRDIHIQIANASLSLGQMQTTLRVAVRAVMSVFAGFNKLGRAPDSSAKLGNVIYWIVHMFKTLLDNLEVLSENGMRKRLTAESATSKKPSPEKSKAKSKSTTNANVKENMPLSNYAAFLGKLIDELDPKIDANKALFEGMAFCVLEKLGNRLYCTVFGQTRAAPLESEILQSKPADEVEDGADQSPQASEHDLNRAKVEAPYLIHLLTRLMVAAPSYLGSAMNSKTGKAKQGNSKGGLKGALAIAAKECLQRTLVNCIFGTEGMDESDPFLDCLKMPVAGDGAIPMPKFKDANTQEWFKEQVWRVLGWDILERDGEWFRGETV